MRPQNRCKLSSSCKFAASKWARHLQSESGLGAARAAFFVMAEFGQQLTASSAVSSATKRTSISRPESRDNTSPSQFKCATSGSQSWPALVLQVLTAPCFSTRRLRTESHQTSVGIERVAVLCERPGGGCRPRETSVPSRVQGVACTARGYRRVDDASPLVAHGLGDSAICSHADGARAASKSP